MSIDPTLTVERLRELLDYDPGTGVFRRRVEGRGSRRKGEVLGSKDACGYQRVGVGGGQYLAHRLAWLYAHGVWPVDQIDHINGVRDDNRLANLREATNAENEQNQRRPRSNNRSGFLGVVQSRSGRWDARIRVNGQVHLLGLHDTPEEASAAYLAAKRELHPFWAEAV